MTRWQKWRALSWADRRLLLAASALLVWARARLPAMDFRPEPAGADTARPVPPAAADLARAQAVARLVGMAAAATPVTVACLHRSVVLWTLLRREGIPCQLRLGAGGTRSGPFEAHAWVECGGVALNERTDHLGRYTPFAAAVEPICGRYDRGSLLKEPPTADATTGSKRADVS
jgi:hypothetical protein